MNNIRTFSLVGKTIIHKAGVVAYQLSHDEEVEVLLITARSRPSSWIFPVGTVDPGESLTETAARECREESGYVVNVEQKIGSLEIKHNDSFDQLNFFLAKTVDEVSDYESDRRRLWVKRSELLVYVADVFLPIAQTALNVIPERSELAV